MPIPEIIFAIRPKLLGQALSRADDPEGASHTQIVRQHEPTRGTELRPHGSCLDGGQNFIRDVDDGLPASTTDPTLVRTVHLVSRRPLGAYSR